jgi:hypothetical protein
MIDGARYDESFGAGATNLPHIWNDLRPKGTVYTNFRNDGITKTCAGHSAVPAATSVQTGCDCGRGDRAHAEGARSRARAGGASPNLR